MYGSTLDNIFRNNNLPTKYKKFFTKFEKEIQNINIHLYKIVGEAFYKKLTKNKTYNKEGTFLSLYLQMWEYEILQLTTDVARENNLISTQNVEIILAHDGFMIKKDLFTDKYSIENLVQDINFAIHDRFKLDVKVKVKPFDEKDNIYKALKNENISWTDEYEDTFEAKYGIMRDKVFSVRCDDECISELFYKKQKNNYAYCNKTFYGLVDNGLYKPIIDKTFRNIYSKYMKDFIKELDHYDITTPETQATEIEKKFMKIYNIANENNIELDKSFCKKSFQLMSFVKDADQKHKSFQDKVRAKILNESKKGYIINRLYQKFSNDDFEETLDTNPYLLGFENGVWDTRTMEFRDAEPGEFVSMSVGYTWNKYFDDEKIKTCNDEVIKNEFKKIKTNAEYLMCQMQEWFKEEEDLDYLLKASSRCLEGDSNKEEVAHFMKGGGGNGKSVYMDLQRLVMGDYYYTFPYTYFSHPKTDNRDPTLYGAAKKRCIAVHEPDEGFVWHADVYKRSTGNDMVGARNNYGTKDIHFKLGHFWIPANHNITFNSDTGGTSMKRRIRGLEFPYTFKTGEEYNEWKKDHSEKDHWKLKRGNEDFKKDIESGYFTQAFMYILMGAFKRYKKDGIELTENFKKDTEEYFNNLSGDKEWFLSNIRKSTSNDEKINLCVTELRRKHREDENLNWSGKTFCNKLREFYPNCEIKPTSGYDTWGNRKKGRMLIGFTMIKFQEYNEDEY